MTEAKIIAKPRPQWTHFDQLIGLLEKEREKLPSDPSRHAAATAIAERIVGKYQISREVQRKLIMLGLTDWIVLYLLEEAAEAEADEDGAS